MSHAKLKVGLVLNPVAGLGGAVGLKGSDGTARQAMAIERGAQAQAKHRCHQFLTHLLKLENNESNIVWLTCAGDMGSACFTALDIPHDLVSLQISHEATRAADTQAVVAACCAARVDLIVFVGGDGTARDVMSSIDPRIPVIGVPAGVKMHSGVFAVTPRAAAELLHLLSSGGLVACQSGEVRDYDDASIGSEEGITVTRYGELKVPQIGGYLQQTKVGGKESEPLTVEEIRAHCLEYLPRDRPLVLGPGSTSLAVKKALACPGTLRGCDIIYPNGTTDLDVTAETLESLTNAILVVSFTREQGFLFGRGNQQISARFLRSLQWPEDVYVIGSRTKLLSLDNRPLLVDTSDQALDESLCGLIEIITGYEDSLLYLVSNGTS